MLSVSDYTELASYEKVHRSAYLVVLHFFNNHLDLLFSKFDSSLIEPILTLIMRGLKANAFDI